MACVPRASGDFELTMDELRTVARFVAESAAQVLPLFEDIHPDDPRPRAAIDAAWEFVNGANRSRRQRVTSLDAHRAARDSATEVAKLAARCAGDAASAAYLHPLAQAGQVGHILRAAASVAHIAELEAGGDTRASSAAIEEARGRATPTLIDVLRRYPTPAPGRSRDSQLMARLDALLRACR